MSDRRYFVDLNGKYDGSSQFGANNHFAPFWSTGVGWNIQNEKFMENAEKVVSRIEIAEKVWSTHFDTGTNFIDVYINYLRKKMDKNFDVKLIHTKPGVGFILTSRL